MSFHHKGLCTQAAAEAIVDFNCCAAAFEAMSLITSLLKATAMSCRPTEVIMTVPCACPYGVLLNSTVYAMHHVGKVTYACAFAGTQSKAISYGCLAGCMATGHTRQCCQCICVPAGIPRRGRQPRTLCRMCGCRATAQSEIRASPLTPQLCNASRSILHPLIESSIWNA